MIILLSILLSNTVLQGTFGPKRDEITGGSRKLHSAELHNLYASPHIITMVKSSRVIWARHVARMVGKKTAYRVWVERPEVKRTIGRPRHR
jgi:hypothetical protein